MFIILCVNAQKESHNHTKKCNTEEYYARQMEQNPMFLENIKKEGERIQRENSAKFAAAREGTLPNLEAIVTIPVVFHIVGDATMQAGVTDIDCKRLVDILNRDFAGVNEDRTKVPAAFQPVFGTSQIRFALARRTPGASPVCTNGIERRVTSTLPAIGTSNDNLLKTFAGGGLDAWEDGKYFNLWVARVAGGLLGWATFPGSSPASQGVVMGWEYFDQPCTTGAQAYKFGRTISHEVGHYFYLYHIWGDDGTGCASSDFREQAGLPITSSCTDDTPNQGNETFGCYAPGSLADGDECTPNAPGKMWMNYMDYTDDQCMYMFTKAQACRMETCINLYRAGFLTTQGHIPVTGTCATTNNGRISESTLPESRGFACNLNATYSACVATLSPSFLLANDGDAPITTAAIQIICGGTLVTTYNFTGNIAPGDVITIVVPTINLPAGQNQLFEVKLTTVNGVADAILSGNSAFSRVSIVGAAQALPLAAESFEGTFPPAGWRIFNPNAGSITWTKSTTAGNPGTASAKMDFYNYNANNQFDILSTPKVITTGLGSLSIDFNVAYANYLPFNVNEQDTLEVVYSTDCGITWKPTGYKKFGPNLQTSAPQAGAFTPTATQWRAEKVVIDFCTGTPPEMQIGFKGTTKFGNNLYIDNVVVAGSTISALDAGISSITSPTTGPACIDAINPVVVLTNYGSTNITSATITYGYTGSTPQVFAWTGALNRCQTATVTLPSIAFAPTVAATVFTATVTAPNGGVDANALNNAASVTMGAFPIAALPIVENFSVGATLASWGVLNYNAGSRTWLRNLTLGNYAPSLKIEFFDYNNRGQVDIVRTPQISLNNVDSLIVKFDWSYAMYSAADIDTVELVASYDCGATWVPFGGYKRFGQAMVTNSTVDPAPVVTVRWVPTSAAQWRTFEAKVSTCEIPSSKIMIGWRSTTQFGNDYYLDNVSITSKAILPTDIATTLLSPNNANLYCDAAAATPKVRISNRGFNPITSATINYSYNNGAVVSQLWTATTPLARCQFVDVTLNPMTATPIIGGAELKVYSSNPNGGVDNNLNNDSTKVFIYITNDAPAGLVKQDFEGPSSLTSNFWMLFNQDGLATWEKTLTGNVGYNPSGATGPQQSGLLNNFDYNAKGTNDTYVSPKITPAQGADSVILSFAYSYKPGYVYPGSTTQQMDSLEVFVSTDCGTTKRSLWKKYGLDLHTQTGNFDFADANPAKYTPKSNSQWRLVRLNLGPIVGMNKFNVFFNAKGNNQNQLWIDTINISSVVLPAKLKSQGYLVYPSPFTNTFRVQHYNNPIDLKGIQIFNSTGQLVWDARYNGNANSIINVDMKNLAAGLYVVKMNYTNKTVSERVMKL